MDLLKSENDENITLEFHEACKRGDVAKATNLLQRKEEIDVKQLDKNHTLERAVMYGDLEIVKLLLKIGVNVNQKDRFFGFRPLHLVCAKDGNLTIAKVLLENGADMDAIVKIFNQTALHYTVLHQKTSITKLLLKYGCKTSIRNHRGLTALELAMKKDMLIV